MAAFSYAALDNSGKEQRGVLEAARKQAVLALGDAEARALRKCIERRGERGRERLSEKRIVLRT